VERKKREIKENRKKRSERKVERKRK